jgi:hypothetical protein
MVADCITERDTHTIISTRAFLLMTWNGATVRPKSHTNGAEGHARRRGSPPIVVEHVTQRDAYRVRPALDQDHADAEEQRGVEQVDMIDEIRV